MAPVSRVISDADLGRLIETVGVEEAARRTGLNLRSLARRRRNLERKFDTHFITPTERMRGVSFEHPGKLDFKLANGVVLIGSDAHYWPGKASTAHRALIALCKEYKPRAVILNGDVLDGATISRHPPINWNKLPSLKEELEVVRERLDEITLAAGKSKRFWTLGNHDARFEAKLASVAPEFKDIKGVSLHDHFPDWEPCWMVVINDEVVVKHRWKGGDHAPWNNTIRAGMTIVTGHLHSQKSYPFTDYKETRWGVDSGTMAEPYGPQFEYTELSPVNWRAGLIVLKWTDGMMHQPSLVRVVKPGLVDFNNEFIRV